MKRKWSTMALMVGLCATAWGGDFSAALHQARGCLGHLPFGERVVAEKRKEEWLVVGLVAWNPGDDDLKQIAKTTTLESLEVSMVGHGTEEGWRNLTALYELQHLSLCFEPEATPEALKSLSILAKTERLDLFRCTKMTAAALVHLKSFPDLRTLKLPDGLDDASLAHITGLKRLEALTLRSPTISDEALSQLILLPRLAVLDVYQVGPRTTVALGHLQQLESLSVHFCAERTGLIDLSGWVSLKALTLGDAFAGGPVRLPVNLRRLKVLGWTAEDIKAGWFHLAEPLPKSLEAVNVRCGCTYGGEDMRRPDLRWLGRLSKLRELTLDEPYKNEIAIVADCAHLRALTLTGPTGIVTDEDIRQVAGMKQLESLAIRISEPEITDAGISALGGLKSLRRLELRWIPKLTPVGLEDIWKLTGLEALSLGLPVETAEGAVEKALAGIASLVNLQELTLRGKVTDAMLKSLAQLKKLRRLDLSGSQGFTDSGLAELVKSVPELKAVAWSYAPAAPKPDAKKGE